MAIKVCSFELDAAIFAAIQEHGRQVGIADKEGKTTLARWGSFVRADGHKIPDLNRWLTREVRLSIEPLLGLAEVFRSYDVKVGKDLMPKDYFVSILIYGTPQSIAPQPQEVEANPQTTVAWLKREIKGLSRGDRLVVLGWFCRLVGGRLNSDEADTQSQLRASVLSCRGDLTAPLRKPNWNS